MKILSLFLLLSLSAFGSFGQSGTVYDFDIKSQYLTNGKLKFYPAEKKTIEFDVVFIRYTNQQTGEFLNPTFKFVLFTQVGSTIKHHTFAYEVKGSDFPSGQNSFTKTFSAIIDATELASNASPIGLRYTVDGGQEFAFQNQSYEWLIDNTLYYNTLMSSPFTKNNCSGGYTGSTVTYQVAANTHSSYISVADANSKAQGDINANGQSYANANGTCIIDCSTSVSLLGGPSTVYSNNYYEYYATAPGGSTYQWTVSNNKASIYSGQGTDNIVLKTATISSTSYPYNITLKVKVTNTTCGTVTEATKILTLRPGTGGGN